MFQSIRLPLTDDSKEISHIYSAVNYDHISMAHYEYYGTKP